MTVGFSRVCFQLQVDRAKLEEYRQRHAAVWPEMLDALQASGWRNYSLFVRDDGLVIGYFETADVDGAISAMAASEVNTRWQAEMAPFFLDLGGTADDGIARLVEVFNLADQLGERSNRSENT